MCSSIAVDLEEMESAATLAEKYLDFTILVQLCDRTSDSERLVYYLEKYEKKVKPNSGVKLQDGKQFPHI